MRALAEAIVASYQRQRRDLPWRRTRDPYAIWISEIMLQQTRVATVIPYWERWMARFPTVADLAAAPEPDVLAAWAGLGYYTRARNLHRGARWVVEHGGALPRGAAELRAIPGIGAYTAGAIASIAHGARAALVDGNVSRVLARVLGLDVDVKSSAGQRASWAAAEALVAALPAHLDPGELNQGLMELGATVCTPTSRAGRGSLGATRGTDLPRYAPACLVCPLAGQCVARRDGREHELPVMPRRKAAAELPVIREVALWLTRGPSIAMARRGPDGLYAGLWELPQGADAPAAAAAVGLALAGHAETFASHAQTLSHRRLELTLARGRATGTLRPGGPRYVEARWIPRARAAGLGVSSATTALLAAAALGKVRRPR